MQGKVEKVGLAPWEEEYARDKKIAERTSFTRSQWFSMGRRVWASNADAVKTITVRSTGATLFLFDESQTEPLESRQQRG